MKSHAFKILAFCLAMACSAPPWAQQGPEFKPFKLVGNWKFVNNNGTNYGGDIEIAVKAMDNKGVMSGLISYDGRQTNDKCGTKPLFSDTPVPVEVSRSEKTYRITFQVSCASGTSPRTFSWTFACDEKGVCTQPSFQPWGKGMTTLAEKLE